MSLFLDRYNCSWMWVALGIIDKVFRHSMLLYFLLSYITYEGRNKEELMQPKINKNPIWNF